MASSAVPDDIDAILSDLAALEKGLAEAAIVASNLPTTAASVSANLLHEITLIDIDDSLAALENACAHVDTPPFRIKEA